MITYHPQPWSPGLPPPARGFRAVAVSELGRVANCMLRFVWAPIVWKDGRRAERNFVESWWCAYDFEDPEYTLGQAMADFADSKHIIATTRSHQIAKGGLPAIDRFRVVVPWAEPIADVRVYRWNMRREQRKYPMDASCIDGARLFFPCRELVSVNDEPDAYAQQVDYDVADDFEGTRMTAPQGVEQLRALKASTPFAQQWLTHEIPVGKRNTYCYGIAKDLTYAGLEIAEIRARILASPTYSGQSLPDDILIDLEECTRNGARDAIKQMAAAARKK